MRLRALRFPDLALWHNDLDFSWPVRDALVVAYRALRQAATQLDAYAAAVAAVESVAEGPMSIRQRIRVSYVYAMAYAAIGGYQQALGWLDEAITLSYDLDDTRDLLDLLYLRGAINRGALRFGESARDYREYLAVLEDQGSSPDSLDATLTHDVLVQLASAEFHCADYETAEQVLQRARGGPSVHHCWSGWRGAPGRGDIGMATGVAGALAWTATTGAASSLDRRSHLHAARRTHLGGAQSNLAGGNVRRHRRAPSSWSGPTGRRGGRTPACG